MGTGDMDTRHDQDNPSRIKNDAMAALNDSRVGIITSINKEGLSFHYAYSKTLDHKNAGEVLKVHIFHTDGFSLPNIPCKIITDEYIQPKYSFGLIALFECCIQFTAMTANQKEQLENFISRFRTGGFGEDTEVEKK
jgi:hypothetical protein